MANCSAWVSSLYSFLNAVNFFNCSGGGRYEINCCNILPFKIDMSHLKSIFKNVFIRFIQNIFLRTRINILTLEYTF